MKNLIVFSTLVVVVFYSGCGFVSLLGTPSRHEKKIPAEYELANHKDQRILVLVDQPAWLEAEVNLRLHLTEAIGENLIKKTKIAPECVVGYSELSKFRSNESNFSLLSPVEVGKALDANVVLFVLLEDYQLGRIAETGYYKGFLGAQSILVDVKNAQKVWPESEKSKSIKVGFEVEENGREAATTRLVNACAHCTVRYLYNCPKDKFKIFDDRTTIGWKNWNK